MAEATVKSIRMRLVDLLLARLVGDSATPRPASLGNVALNKSRRVPIGTDEIFAGTSLLPAKSMYSIYFVNQAGPTAVGGNTRRPVLVEKTLLVEVRIIVKGDDATADPHYAWIVQRLVSADRCVDAEGTQLALSVLEGENQFGSLDGTLGEVLETRVRFAVEYTTKRDDVTVTR